MGSCSSDHAIALKPQKFSFKTRKEGLKKKIRELTTLCDAQACMIIFPPKQTQTNTHHHHAEIWPEKLEDFNKVIQRYNKTSNSNKKQQEDEMTMQNNNNNNDSINNYNLEAYSKQQLEAILQNIDFNIETIKQKMNPIEPMPLQCSMNSSDPMQLLCSSDYVKQMMNPMPLHCSSEYDYVNQTMNSTDPMPLLCSSEYDYANQKMNPIDPMSFVCSTDYDGDYYYEYGSFYFSGSLDDSTAMGSSESLVNFMC